MSTVPPPPPPPAPEPVVMPPTPPAGQSVPNYLAWAIISTVIGFCTCCPALVTGIVAIVFSSKVNSYLNAGDIEAAKRASANAKIWCWVTTALAIIGVIFTIVSLVTGGAQEYMRMINQMQSM